MRDASTIGSTQATKDPESFFKKTQGTYKDNCEGLPEKQRTDFAPRAPDPAPFLVRR